MNEFDKFAVKGRGISSMTLHRYTSSVDAYINPTITEERQLNVAQMDVFSRLMMDRIIFLGVPIDDDVARRSCCSWRPTIPLRTSRCTSTRPAVR